MSRVLRPISRAPMLFEQHSRATVWMRSNAELHAPRITG
jgi:hypothetical protein